MSTFFQDDDPPESTEPDLDSEPGVDAVPDAEDRETIRVTIKSHHNPALFAWIRQMRRSRTQDGRKVFRLNDEFERALYLLMLVSQKQARVVWNPGYGPEQPSWVPPNAPAQRSSGSPPSKMAGTPAGNWMPRRPVPPVFRKGGATDVTPPVARGEPDAGFSKMQPAQVAQPSVAPLPSAPVGLELPTQDDERDVFSDLVRKTSAWGD